MFIEEIVTVQIDKLLEFTKSDLPGAVSQRRRLKEYLHGASIATGLSYEEILETLSKCVFRDAGFYNEANKMVVPILFGAPEAEPTWLFVEHVSSVIVRKEFLRYLNDSPQLHDVVYINNLKRENDKLGLGVNASMGGWYRNSVPMSVVSFNENGRGQAFLSCEYEFESWNFNREWLSFVPKETVCPFAAGLDFAIDPMEDKVKSEKAIERALDDAFKKHKEYAPKFPKGILEQRCGFSVVYFDKYKDKVDVANHLKTVCHARLNCGGKVLGVVDCIQMHLDRTYQHHLRKPPFYANPTDYINKFSEFFNYWTNRGPMSRVFKTKNMFDALESGVRYDCNYPLSAIAIAAIGLRMMGEFPEMPAAYAALKEKLPEGAAAVLALLSSYDAEEGWEYTYRGFHDLIPATATVDIFDRWDKSDFPVWSQDPANKATSSYKIYSSLAHNADQPDLYAVTKSINLASSKASDSDYVSLESFVEATLENDFIRRMVK